MSTSSTNPNRVVIPSAPTNILNLQTWVASNAQYVENLIGVPIDGFCLSYSKQDGISIAYDVTPEGETPVEPAE